MKRDFLEGIGLERSVIDSIMAEHGKSVCGYKEQLSALEGLSDENRALKEENRVLSDALKYTEEKFNSFRIGIISELVEEARPSSRAAGEHIKRLLLGCENGEIKRCLSRIKEEEPEAFSALAEGYPVFSSDTAPDIESPMSLHFTGLR